MSIAPTARPSLAAARPVERIPAPSLAEFRRDWLKADRPVVLTGLMDDWPAMTAWTDEALVELVHHTASTS